MRHLNALSEARLRIGCAWAAQGALTACLHPHVRLLDGVELPASFTRPGHVPVPGLTAEIEHPECSEGNTVGLHGGESGGKLRLRFGRGCSRNTEPADKERLLDRA